MRTAQGDTMKGLFMKTITKMTLVSTISILVGFILFGSSFAGSVPGADVTYTSDADFNQGVLFNVNHDITHDQLQLNKTITPFPFINVAASGRGTIVRIDVNTGQILGEYYTAPNGMGRNPSRTTVDLYGNVWVSNRDESGKSPAGSQTSKGSVTRVGLVIGGTRVNQDGTSNSSGQFLAPPFQYNTCVDKNNDGLIKTSRVLGNILPWSNAGGADTHGGISTADDECIINYTRTIATNARTVAIDSNNDVWVGGANMAHSKIDGKTGQPVAGTQFNLGCGGYGGLIDRNGVLWSAQYGNGLLRFDTKTMTGKCLGNSMGDYGLAIDPLTGNIWHSSCGSGYVGKIAPDGTLLGRYNQGTSCAQGVTVDASNNVWVAHSHYSSTVGHLKTNGTYVGTVSVGSGPTGVAVDANGKVWATNYYSHNAVRIDPNGGAIGGGGNRIGAVNLTVSLGSGAYPYNYSDMTGFVAVGSTSPQGSWVVVQDSGAIDNNWKKITWNTEPQAVQPIGTEIIVEARSSNTETGLAGQAYISVKNSTSFLLIGRFIQVRVTLKPNKSNESPMVSDIQIKSGFASVQAIDTISNNNIELDQSSFVKTPNSIITEGDKTIVEWDFKSFALNQEQDLSFDIILKSLIPGEDRLVNHKLELIYEDMDGNPVRTELGPYYVHVLSSAFEGTIATDRPSYNANEDTIISGFIKNLSEYGRTIDAKIFIEDTQGALVKEVTTPSDLTFAVGETKALSNIVFNTGSTLAGSYRAHLVLIDNGNQVGEAYAPFTIIAPSPDLSVTSNVVTDKISYNANEQVGITSTVQSTSVNAILYNLTAGITLAGSDGISLFTDTKTIPILGPGARVDLTSYWNTGTHPKGSYTVTLEVQDGITLLSTSQAVFTIIGSSGNAVGLTGTITSAPNPIFQGLTETVNYTVSNSGNEGVIGTIKILIVNPDTQEVKQTFNIPATLTAGGAAIGNVTVPTLSLEPHIYLAVLQFVSPAMTQPKTLANAAFEVKPGVEITKTIPDSANLLVWVNKKCEPLEPSQCIRIDLLAQILTEAGANYHIVYNKEDFETEMRNPFYTDFIILGHDAPLTDHYGEELREQVHSGKGLISSLYLKHGQCLAGDGIPLFGLEYYGQLSGSTHTVTIPEGPLCSATSLTTQGNAVRVEADHPENTMAWINTPTQYPGIIGNLYGNGKTLYFAFDVGKTLDDNTYGTLSTILKNALSYVHTPTGTTAFYPGRLVPVTITLQNFGGASDLTITETYPQEIKIYNPISGQWLTDNPWTFTIHLNAGETKKIVYYAVTPDQAGTYTLVTDVQYMTEGGPLPYRNLNVVMTVTSNTAVLTQNIVTALNALQVTNNNDKTKVKNALKSIGDVQSRSASTLSDIEKNILDILKAVDFLMEVQSANIANVRFMMDELLKTWEGKWQEKRWVTGG